jgi:hypothetical protein
MSGAVSCTGTAIIQAAFQLQAVSLPLRLQLQVRILHATELNHHPALYSMPQQAQHEKTDVTQLFSTRFEYI